MKVRTILPMLIPGDNTFIGVPYDKQQEYTTLVKHLLDKSSVEIKEPECHKAFEILKETNGKDFDCKVRAVAYVMLGIKH